MISFMRNKMWIHISVLVVVLCFAAPQWCTAQTRVLAFSQIDMMQIDGFNNGNVAIAPNATVPITIGIFDSQTGMLSPLDTETALLVQLFDANGNAHENLVVSGGVFLPAEVGTTVRNSTIGISWSGTGSTTATLVVADTSSVLPALSLSILLDPSLSPSLSITALLIHDANGNNVYDESDSRINAYAIEAYPLHYLLQASGEVYTLDMPQYSGDFPLHLRPFPSVVWRSVEEQGVPIAEATVDTAFIFMEQASTIATFSGFQHGLFGQMMAQVEDSLCTLSGFVEKSSAVIAMHAPSWYTTGLAIPLPSSTQASFSLTAFGEQEHCFSCRFGALVIACTSGTETVTPDFSASGSAAYHLTVYHKGEAVYTEHNRSGAGVVLPRAVRRWGVEENAFVVEELLPRTITIANGATVFGDRIVFTPQEGNKSVSALLAVEIAGAEMETIALYKHELRLFGIAETCTGDALLSGVQSTEAGVQVTGGTTGGLVITPSSAKGVVFHWTTGGISTSNAQPWMVIEARTAEEALSLGEIALFAGTDTTLSCRALSSSYGNQERVVSVYNNDVLIATVRTTEETIAQYTEQPAGCSATTQYGVQGYRLLWENNTEFALPNGAQVAGNQLFVAFRSANRLSYSLLEVEVKPTTGALLSLRPIQKLRDTLLLTATITIIGEVFDDKNGDKLRQSNELGIPNRRICIYGDIATNPSERDTVFTDANGKYQAVYTSGHWAPERVALQSLPPWQRTTPAPPASPDYDIRPIVGNGQHSATAANLDFGETMNIYANSSDERTSNAGVDDNFSTADPDELVMPSTALSAWLVEGGHSALGYFDPVPRDQWFAHSLPTLCTAECVATGATVSMRLRAGSSLSYNDAIILQKDGRRLWSAPIAALTASQTWFADRTEECTLDLAALPQSDGTTIDLYGDLQHGEIDVLISDDTGIDYLTYLVRLSCEPAVGSSLSTGVANGQEDAFHTRIVPTPNNGAGRIEFFLPQSETVTISLVDVVQKERLRIVDAVPLLSGRHTIGFSFPFLPSGVYFLQIATGTTVSSHRFVLLR